MSTHRCPYCKSADVHRSRRRGVFEIVVLRPFLLRPYRCWMCFRRHYGSDFGLALASKVGPWAVSIGPVLRLFQGVSLLLVLGIPVVLASSAPVLETLDRLGFTGLRATGHASRNRSPIPSSQTPLALDSQPLEPQPAEPPVPSDGMSASAMSGRIEWSHFALASATPQQAIGELRTAGEVYVNESKVPAETTTFFGDTLRTGAGGSATVEVPGKGTLLILEQTRISFGGPGGYFAELKQGAVILHALGGAGNFEVQIGDFVVTPDPAAEAGADIQRAADGSAHVKATLGSVGLIGLRGSETVFIHAGQEMDVSSEGRLFSPAPSQPSQPPQPTPPVISAPVSVQKKKSLTPWVAVGTGGAAAAAVAAILAAGGGGNPKSVSPSVP